MYIHKDVSHPKKAGKFLVIIPKTMQIIAVMINAKLKIISIVKSSFSALIDCHIRKAELIFQLLLPIKRFKKSPPSICRIFQNRNQLPFQLGNPLPDNFRFVHIESRLALTIDSPAFQHADPVFFVSFFRGADVIHFISPFGLLFCLPCPASPRPATPRRACLALPRLATPRLPLHAVPRGATTTPILSAQNLYLRFGNQVLS
jgi:hypothetical protein